MGSDRSAFIAKNHYQQKPEISTFIGLDYLMKAKENKAKPSRCKKCVNLFDIIIYRFLNAQRYCAAKNVSTL